MTSGTQVWLTRETYERLTDELRRLVRLRDEAMAARGSGDDDTVATEPDDPEAARRDQRIRKLLQLLQDPIVGEEPPDDGVAEPGMVVTVAYADDGTEETFLLAEREQDSAPGIEVCSPGSPLGRALLGAREGEQRSYATPGGQTATVTLLRAVPYGSWLQQA